MESYAIIGFGTAGYHAAKAIREADRTGRIDVYSNTGKAPYNPMLTTYYVSGKLSYEAMFPFGSLEEIKKELDLNMIDRQVTGLKAREHVVETEGEDSGPYDRILVSTGAFAIAPRVAGLKEEDCFLMRTDEDALRLRERLDRQDVKSAVVVGASMVGIKVVELLVNRGIQTVLADLAPYMFPTAAYENVAHEIESRLKARGVGLYFQNTVTEVKNAGGSQVAVMTGKDEVPADIVVLCIGTRANIGFVDPEEVKIGKAIVVNEQMETSVPGVFAAGDCCEGNNLETGKTQIIGLWANANYQGTVAGNHMSGGRKKFDGNILHNITHFMDMDFIGFGDDRAQGTVLTSGVLGKGLYIKVVCRDHEIVGVNILDNYRISGIIKNYMLRLLQGGGNELTVFQKGMLIQAGMDESFIDRLEETVSGTN